MVVEVTGSVIIFTVAAAAALGASIILIDAANTYDTYAPTNVAIIINDRFNNYNYEWGEIILVYPGGPLEIGGDVELCFKGTGASCDKSTDRIVEVDVHVTKDPSLTGSSTCTRVTWDDRIDATVGTSGNKVCSFRLDDILTDMSFDNVILTGENATGINSRVAPTPQNPRVVQIRADDDGIFKIVAQYCDSCARECKADEEFSCWTQEAVGNGIRIRYEGMIGVNGNVEYGDTLSYVIKSTRHTSSGVVGVR